MLRTLREILVTQYIGSILIALLLMEAAIELAQRIGRIAVWLYNHQQNHSVLAPSSDARFGWEYLISSLSMAALYLLSAYALARWLYPHPEPTIAVTVANDQQDQS